MTAKELIEILSKSPEREVFIVANPGTALKTIKSVYIDDAPFRLENFAEQRPWFIEVGPDARAISQNIALARIAELGEVLGEVFKGKGNE
jgi:hypothetical protein